MPTARCGGRSPTAGGLRKCPAATEGRDMRLIGLVESDDHVCCRYRLRAFRQLLTSAGHSLDIRAVPRRWRDRLDTFAALGGADAVVLQHRLLSPWRFRFL